jgi:5-methylcytosine-specific restriction enzyme subunit McrC
MKVFEHNIVGLSKDVIDLLQVLLNEKGFRNRSIKPINSDNSFNPVFTILSNSTVKFHQYVGAIQAGNTTIEILPKIDYEDSVDTVYSGVDNTEDTSKWHAVLIDMLKECKYIKMKHTRNAILDKQKGSLFDVMYFEFMSLCEQLLHAGLVKQYVPVEKNRKALKGKIVFNKHIAKNYIHKERFYTRHTEYSHEMPLNRILYTALKCLTTNRVSNAVRSKAKQLLFQFPEMQPIRSLGNIFEKLTYNRKTEHYRSAIVWAELILTQHLPNLEHGKKKLIAMVFDMNKLWEEYLYHILRRTNIVTSIRYKNKVNFWEPNDIASNKGVKTKQIEPDIVLEVNGRATTNKIVIDAKWKIPKSDTPASTDLMQLFAYSMVEGADKSYLIFPRKDTGEIDKVDGSFQVSTQNNPNGGYMRVSVLDAQGKLNQDLGNEIFEQLYT